MEKSDRFITRKESTILKEESTKLKPNADNVNFLQIGNGSIGSKKKLAVQLPPTPSDNSKIKLPENQEVYKKMQHTLVYFGEKGEPASPPKLRAVALRDTTPRSAMADKDDLQSQRQIKLEPKPKPQAANLSSRTRQIKAPLRGAVPHISTTTPSKAFKISQLESSSVIGQSVPQLVSLEGPSEILKSTKSPKSVKSGNKDNGKPETGTVGKALLNIVENKLGAIRAQESNEKSSNIFNSKAETYRELRRLPSGSVRDR